MILEFTYPENPMPAKRVRFGRSGVYNAPDYEAYLDSFALALKKQYGKSPQLLQNLSLDVCFYRKDARKVDLDNLLKSVMDALTRSSIIKDDSQFTQVKMKLVKKWEPKTHLVMDEDY